MILAFPKDVAERLARIEAEEGIPAVELVHQAVSVWSQLNAAERKRVGFFGLQLIIARIKGGSHG